MKPAGRMTVPESPEPEPQRNSKPRRPGRLTPQTGPACLNQLSPKLPKGNDSPAARRRRELTRPQLSLTRKETLTRSLSECPWKCLETNTHRKQLKWRGKRTNRGSYDQKSTCPWEFSHLNYTTIHITESPETDTPRKCVSLKTKHASSASLSSAMP